MKRIRLIAVTLLLLASCSVQPPKQDGTGGPAGILLTQADEKAAVGDRAQAIALLERAVRLEPRNGYAWLRLGKLYLAKGDSARAEQFARRALQFAGGDRALAEQSKGLLEEIVRQP
jgi:Flp pilus assembly protein TadD